jgi:hypothetical protein
MDPYLEPHWRDFHGAVVPYLRDAVDDALPEALVSRVVERIAIEIDDGSNRYHRQPRPDVRVFEPSSTIRFVDEGPDETEDGSVAVLAPVVLDLGTEPSTELFIQIIDPSTDRLVTVVELLSKSNKTPGPGLYEYVAKREELLSAGVNFVEIDLVRSGEWERLLRPHVITDDIRTPFRYTYRKGNDPTRVGLHPVKLDHPLPPVKIPLRPHDPIATVEIQPLVDRAYAKGRYFKTLDYSKDCMPPLEGADATLAEQLLRAAGKR